MRKGTALIELNTEMLYTRMLIRNLFNCQGQETLYTFPCGRQGQKTDLGFILYVLNMGFKCFSFFSFKSTLCNRSVGWGGVKTGE